MIKSKRLNFSSVLSVYSVVKALDAKHFKNEGSSIDFGDGGWRGDELDLRLREEDMERPRAVGADDEGLLDVGGFRGARHERAPSRFAERAMPVY